MDNAPYHKGVLVQLAGHSKEDMAQICRLRGIQSIKYNVRSADLNHTAEFNCEVPAPGQPWGPVGAPSVENVREGVFRALRQAARELVEIPFMHLIRELEGKWGPPGAPAVEILWNAPMVSAQIAVELTWADAKNEVARAHKQNESRTLATISHTLQSRFTGDFDNKCNNLFRHAERFMTEAIDNDHTENNGPLSGPIATLSGAPSEAVLQEWREIAGITDGYTSEIEEEEDDDEEEENVT